MRKFLIALAALVVWASVSDAQFAAVHVGVGGARVGVHNRGAFGIFNRGVGHRFGGVNVRVGGLGFNNGFRGVGFNNVGYGFNAGFRGVGFHAGYGGCNVAPAFFPAAVDPCLAPAPQPALFQRTTTTHFESSGFGAMPSLYLR